MTQRELPPAPFIVGLARSGTTLLRLMLDAHPALAIPPETHFAPSVIRAFAEHHEPITVAKQAVLASPRWNDFGLPAEEVEQRIDESAPGSAGDFLRVFYRLYAERAGKARWGDKTPPYLDHMARLQQVVPEARFIHIIRDGRDVALSIGPLWWGPSEPAEAGRWWAERIEAARASAPALSGYLEIRYETLVTDTQRVLGSVCEFLELPWSPAMLDYHRTARKRILQETGDVRTRDGLVVAASSRAAIHELTAEPPRSDRVARWRREMPPSAVREFERVAGEMLESCGYELTEPRPPAARAAPPLPRS